MFYWYSQNQIVKIVQVKHLLQIIHEQLYQCIYYARTKTTTCKFH